MRWVSEELPGPVEWTLRTRLRPAYLRCDADGHILGSGGNLHKFGLSGLSPGAKAESVLPFLSGSAWPSQLENVLLDNEVHADVFVVVEGDTRWVVLHDCGSLAQRAQLLQQKTNELGLMRATLKQEQANAVQALVRSMGMLVLARRGDGALVPCTKIPELLNQTDVINDDGSIRVEALSLFLENFLIDAETFWAAGAAGAQSSGPWSEVTQSGEELRMEATAFLLADGAKLLLVEPLSRRHDEAHAMLQTGREQSIAHQQLLEEISRKEILLHCIVHDLANPLTALSGCMSLLAKQDLPEETRSKLLETGQRAAERQNEMIRDILDVFQAELSALSAVPEDGVPVLQTVREVARGLRPAFAARGHALKLQGLQQERAIKAESSRLVRVLENLLQNALRHSPKGEAVTVIIEPAPQGDGIIIDVADRGPGVAEGFVPNLFKRFSQGGNGGKAGLGLYFCKMSVDKWDGSLSYHPRPGGGAIFRIYLLSA